MKLHSLNGAWTLNKAGEPSTIPATVPGCVHMDLLAAGLMEDPFYRDNELKQMWVGETDWNYQRTFTVSEDLIGHDRVLLRCHGLDTLATIQVNGMEIGKTQNMYRTYEFDIKVYLKVGENTLSVYFDAPVPFLHQQEAEKGVLFAWSVGEHRLNAGSWIRKEPCNFGWDWGPMLVTSGIWRDIELIAFNTGRITDLLILQDHDTPNEVTLTIQGAVEAVESTALTVNIEVLLEGQVVASVNDVPVENGQYGADVVVNDPQLWWVNGMGEQTLYSVRVQLHAGDNELDTQTRRIGLRTLTLERHADEWGESFYFACNGIPFFAKGANWIPADTFASRVSRELYESLISDSAAVHMNMLRVWGGGYYEDDNFYDLCDQYGIAIWQDFMFSCGTYPAYDGDFMENVRAEAEDNVRRIRHHACLALWCGNNELEQGLVASDWTKVTMSWEDYSKLFDTLLPEIVGELDPQRAYWPGSPHTPTGNRSYWMNPDAGDTHLWSVWHGKEPFEWYRTRLDRFCSEFGFQSFPEPRTTYSFTLPEDRNITSYVMEHHQRSGIGNSTIIHYLLDWFRLPTSFEATLWLSQILQGMAMKYAIEHWRRNMPRSMGALYWQLNDCWPAPTWSSIDSLGRWKALHYMAEKFFAPLLVSGLEDMEQSTVEIHVTSDLQQDTVGNVRWILTDVNGQTLDSGEQAVSIPARDTQKVTTLDLKEQTAHYNNRDLLLWLELVSGGSVVSDNMVLLSRPKHLEIVQPNIQADVQAVDEQTYDVILTTEHPALYVWLETGSLDARYSDNFFHLRPGRSYTVRVTLEKPADQETFEVACVVQSLIDTYS